MARASASDYNLQISQVDWAQFFKHFWLYADLFQSVAVQSPPTIASIFIFDVIADKVHRGLAGVKQRLLSGHVSGQLSMAHIGSKQR